MIRSVVPSDEAVLTGMAERYLVHLYGDQSKAISEWVSGDGHKHPYLMHTDNNPAGFVCLKADPKKDYAKISTLIVFDGNRGRGLGNKLLSHAEEVVFRNLRYSKLLVTVSEVRQDSLDFFLKKGFEVIHSHAGKYQPDVVEHVLRKVN